MTSLGPVGMAERDMDPEELELEDDEAFGEWATPGTVDPTSKTPITSQGDVAPISEA